MKLNSSKQAIVRGKKCKICGKPIKGDGDIGSTCEEHIGALEKYYVKRLGEPDPTEYVSLVELCDLAESLGKSRYWMVKLTGGDAGVNPPFSPEFTVYKFEKAGAVKYCRRAAITSVRELAKIEKKSATK